MLENLALRQQLLALRAKRPRRRLGSFDKVFWVALRKLWSGWKKPLLLVTPETVVRWHRIGFRLYWSWLSRTGRAAGRKSLSREVRDLIFRMVAENPTWGGSSRQCCESSKVQVLAPSIACIRTARISGACGGNEARSART